MQRLTPFPFLALLIAALVLTVQAAPVMGAGDIKVALVIGNGKYDFAPLKNPVNDANDFSRALKNLGFDVILVKDGNKGAMLKAIDRFGNRLKTAKVGLFYFAGHGVQVNGRNYLIPVSANVEVERDVELEGVDAWRVLGRMEDARTDVNVVILDACRNNPFARSFRSVSRGLARMDAPKGSFVAYATAPGSVALDGAGRNGVFTETLLKYIDTPGLKIEDVFKRVRADVTYATNDRQLPWQSSSLIGDFYFSAPTVAKTPPVAPTPAPSAAPSTPAPAAPVRSEASNTSSSKEVKVASIDPTAGGGPTVSLRSEPVFLNNRELKAMVEDRNYYHSIWNPEGNFPNRFQNHGNGTITDYATGLMWQMEGSGKGRLDGRSYGTNLQNYIRSTNSRRYGGHNDWRIPTADELMSLMEPVRNEKGVLIDPMFSPNQTTLLASDRASSGIYIISFGTGSIILESDMAAGAAVMQYYIKAVRSVD